MRDWIAFLRQRLVLPEMKGQREERMLSELADHLQDLYQEALSRGASKGEAEAQVELALGDADLAARELIRTEPAHLRAQMSRWARRRERTFRRKGGRWTPLADLVRDLRLGVRALAKRPLFTGTVTLVLALGIGASTAIFTLVNGIILSPLPFDDADRLVAVGHRALSREVGDAGQTAAWHFTYEDENRVFEDLGMYTVSSVTLTGGTQPEAVSALGVTSGVFRALRVSPALGRSFTPEDDDPEAPNAVLLSHRYWQTRFGAGSDVLGQTLRIDGQPFEIVGVMPPDLRSLGRDPAFFYPLRFRRSELFVGNIGYDAVARLRDGVTLEQAVDDMARMLPLAFEKFPGGPVADLMAEAQFVPDLRLLKDDLVGHVADLLWFLLAGVAVVLLIACANVANLFLVRAAGKDTEMVVRAAIGADRARIAWEYLKESLILGLLGGVGGLALAQAGLRLLVTSGPAELPRLEEVSLSLEVLLFTLGISLFAGSFFGMLPVLRHGRSEVDALKHGGRGGTEGRGLTGVHNTLAVSQLALALVLLVASGLMIRSFLTLRNVDPGFRSPEKILTLRLRIPPGEIENRAEVASAHELIARRLEEISGVTSVGLSSELPMDGYENVNPLYLEGPGPPGDREPQSRRHKWIGEGYFETLQIPLLVGRTFSWQDVHNRVPGVLVSESLARQYWGSAKAALGQRIAARPEPPRWHEVIGVVGDVREDGMGQAVTDEVYWPQVTLAFWEGQPEDVVVTWRSMSYAIRSNRVGNPGLLEDVREAIWSVNPNLSLRNVESLSRLAAESMASTSFALMLLGVAAAVAFILGVVGVYGVISYAVSARKRELGIRVALGACRVDVMRMVLRQALILSLAGLAIGLAFAFGFTRLMAGLLFHISPVDPVTFAVVPAGLLAVALTASYLPARRAARADPMEALRAE